MGFGDLKSQQGLNSLNEYLKTRSYIEGYQPSQADTVVFAALSGAPPASLPNALRWYKHMQSYGDEKKSFAGQKKDINSYGDSKAAPQPAADNKKDDEDDIDLFGSDEEDAEADKLREERLKAYNDKKSKKPGVIAKSSVILDVKPWDDETDMKEMEKKVRTVTCDGLIWGASKLVPVGYGINKLQIMSVVEDEKVSIDWLQEEIQNFEDLVQSVDIAAFNKI